MKGQETRDAATVDEGPWQKGEPQPWNMGEAIGVAWLAFRERPWFFLFLTFAALLPFMAGLTMATVAAVRTTLSIRGEFARLTTTTPMARSVSAVLADSTFRISAAVVLLAILTFPVVRGGYLAIFSAAVRGEPIRGADFQRALAPRVAFSLLALALLQLLTFVVTLPMLAVPAAGFALAPFYVVDASMTPFQAMGASWRATRGQRFAVWLYLAGFVVALVIGLLLGGVGLFVTLPLYGMGLAYASTRLSARTRRPLFSPDWGSRYLRSFLRLAFVALAAAFGVASLLTLRQPPRLRAGWSLDDAAIRVGAVLLGVGLVVSALAAVLPGILDLLERRGFSAFVGARHVRSQKSGFLTIISVLSIFGVALSSCSLSSVSSIMGGFSADLKRKILGNNAHIVIDTESRAAFEGWEAVVQGARAVPGVSGATPVVQGEVMVQSASNLAGVIVRGVDPESIGNVIDLKANIEVGRFEYLSDPDKLRRLPADEVVGVGKNGERFLKGKDILPLPDDLDPSVREAMSLKPLFPSVVIGRELAKTLHVYVGDEVTLVSPLGDLGPMGVLPRMKKFRVAAIFYSGMYEYDASHVYVTLDVAQQYFDLPGKVHFVDLRSKDVQATDQVTPLVRAQVARGDLRVRDWREINRNLFSALKLERFAMFLILSIAIMVASFCIVCTLLLMVTEKGKDIAILKAMGASDTAILRTFMGEGMIIGAIGTAFGVTMAMALCLGLSWFGLPLNPEVYYIDKLPVNVELQDFLLVALAALTICTLSTIYPAKAASRIRPVDGLRYE